MNKKGFTLIELLAVIVILAVIALILIPVVSGLIENSKKASAARSVEGYIEAANNASTLYMIDQTRGLDITSDKHTFTSGSDELSFSKIEASGKLPTYVYLDYDINTKVVSEGHFCMDGYSILYTDSKGTKVSDTNYCVTDEPGEVIVIPVDEGNSCVNAQAASDRPIFKYEALGEEDDYIYECKGGEWSRHSKAGYRWDGYIFNNGAYDETYFDGQTNSAITAGAGGVSISNSLNATNFQMNLTGSAPGPAGYGPGSAVWIFTKPISIDRQCRIRVTFEQQGLDSNYQSTYPSQIYQAIFLRSDTSTVATGTGVVVSSGIIMDNNINEYTFDLRNQSYVGRNLYLGVSVGYPPKTFNTVATGYVTAFRIKTIQVIYE